MLLDKYFGGKLHGKQKKYSFLIIIFVLFLSKGLEYYNWNVTYGGWISKVIYLLLFTFVLKQGLSYGQQHFRKEILCLMILHFPSMVNSWIFFGQSPLDSIIASLNAFIFVTYFMFHYYKVEEKTILKSILIISILIVSIQVIQQFSYPNCWFGIYDEEKQLKTKGIAELRNGLWRFRMHLNCFYTCPILFLTWGWLQKKFNGSLLLFSILLMVSVYLSLTRQVMAACIFSIIVSSIMVKGKVKMGAILMGLVFILGLFFYYDALFSDMAAQTEDEATDENVRIISAMYFFEESIKSPLTVMFGYGNPSNNSAFGVITTDLGEDFGFYSGDVGFIGQMYHKGVLFVLITYYLFYKMLYKFKSSTPKYIKMMVIFCLPMTPMISGWNGSLDCLLWCMMMYICDLHINGSNLVLQQTK